MSRSRSPSASATTGTNVNEIADDVQESSVKGRAPALPTIDRVVLAQSSTLRAQVQRRRGSLRPGAACVRGPSRPAHWGRGRFSRVSFARGQPKRGRDSPAGREHPRLSSPPRVRPFPESERGTSRPCPDAFPSSATDDDRIESGSESLHVYACGILVGRIATSRAVTRAGDGPGCPAGAP